MDKDPRKDRRYVDLQATFEGTFVGLVSKLQFFVGLEQDAAIHQVVARFANVFRSLWNPVIDEGYIPPTLTCTEAELDWWFGLNGRRRELLERIHTWISLASAVKARRFLLDGSFVTAKGEPGDVDAVILLPEDFCDQLRDGNREAVTLRDMVLTRKPKELFAAEDEVDWWRWVEFFGRTREANGRRKGLIEVTL
jgi:hypothetical protein